jgi:hypothetical protein
MKRITRYVVCWKPEEVESSWTFGKSTKRQAVAFLIEAKKLSSQRDVKIFKAIDTYPAVHAPGFKDGQMIWRCIIEMSDGEKHIEWADTAPLAICRAALKAVGHE